jgi:hypothetical protein
MYVFKSMKRNHFESTHYMGWTQNKRQTTSDTAIIVCSDTPSCSPNVHQKRQRDPIDSPIVNTSKRRRHDYDFEKTFETAKKPHIESVAMPIAPVPPSPVDEVVRITKKHFYMLLKQNETLKQKLQTAYNAVQSLQYQISQYNTHYNSRSHAQIHAY